MMIDPKRYTSGRIALANLSASIEQLELSRIESASCEGLLTLSNLLFLRGDLLGRIADHDRAELAGVEAITLAKETGVVFYTRARLVSRFHRFEEAKELLDKARDAGYPIREIDLETAGLLQATGQYNEALALRERLAKADPGIHTLGALATLLAEMDQWDAAEARYTVALDRDDGMSPIPCAQLLFEWGVNAMRRGSLERAEEIFAELDLVFPAHVPGRGHRAEVALARRDFHLAGALIKSLVESSDDPEYRTTYAEILAARGQEEAAAIEAEQAAARYELLLARRPEAYADHAAFFFIGIGNRPERAVELAFANWELRDTPRSRNLLDKALRNSRQASLVPGGVA
jgi:tetratricopeptide (TPR) repeat protein